LYAEFEEKSIFLDRGKQICRKIIVIYKYIKTHENFCVEKIAINAICSFPRVPVGASGTEEASQNSVRMLSNTQKGMLGQL